MGITANRLLRQERLKRGWSEQDLADRIQQWEYEHGDGHDLPVDRNYVHRWETGKRGVSAFYAVRLEGVFGRSRQELGLVDRRSRQLVGSANIRSADDGEPIPPVESAGDAMLGASPESGSAVQRRAFNRLVVAGGMTAVGIAIAAERVASGPDAPSVTRPLVQLYAPEATTAIRKAMLAGDGATAVQEPDVTAFRQGVSRAWELRQSARYVELLSVLPALILEAEAAIQHVDGDERVEAYRLFAHTYNTVSSVLKKLGDFEFASMAADRAIRAARAIDDRLLGAAASYRLANVFLPAGRLAETKDVALTAADALEPSASSLRRGLAVVGGLRLTAAIAAARQGAAAEAWRLHAEATVAAGQLREDHADLYTIFGPTNLAIHGVQIAAELGDGREVLRRAGRVDPDRLPRALLERRSHFLIDLARGHAQQVEDAAAVAVLVDADGLAPEEVRFNPAVVDLVALLLRRERRNTTPGLRVLAGSLGLAS
jgi:transcriptional regulator with XRE-family HTH domain